jgi:hypothetical protein
MPAGFQAFTDTGLVQIDGTTQNYALRQTLTVNTAAGSMNIGKSNSGTQWTITANVSSFTINALQPLVVIYSPNAYATLLHCIPQGSNNWAILLWSSVAAPITVYVFDQSSAAVPSGPGFGLQVFDANGILVADARQRLARIVDTQAGNIMGAGPGWGQWNQRDNLNASWSYPTVQKIGVAAIGTALVSSPTGGNSSGWYDISGLQTAGNTVNFQWQYYQQGNAPHPGNNVCFGYQYNWRFMAVDLSYI